MKRDDWRHCLAQLHPLIQHLQLIVTRQSHLSNCGCHRPRASPGYLAADTDQQLALDFVAILFKSKQKVAFVC